MPDGKVTLILVLGAMLIAGAGTVGRGVKAGASATKNGVVKVFHHIHPKGAVKAVVNHQK